MSRGKWAAFLVALGALGASAAGAAEVGGKAALRSRLRSELHPGYAVQPRVGFGWSGWTTGWPHGGMDRLPQAPANPQLAER